MGSDSSLSGVDPDDEETVGEASVASVELDSEHLCYNVGAFLAKVMSLRARILDPLFLTKATQAPDQRPDG